MSIQTIINNAVSIKVDRRKVVGQTVSRSGQVKIGSIASNVPWVFTVSMHTGLKYSANRSLVEELDRLDRVFTETIDIGGSNPGLGYITEYKGDLEAADVNQLSVASTGVLTVTLNVNTISNPNVTSTSYIFRAGDYFQLDNGYKYPYTVTADVLRGSGTTVTVPINRPFINQASYTEVGKGVVVGSDVTWQVVMSKKPSWIVIPHDRIQFSDAFELVEVIED